MKNPFMTTASFGTVCFLTFAGLTAVPAQANQTAVSAKLSLTFQGLPVGELKHTSTVSGSGYKITGVVNTNSLVSLIAGVKANFNASGQLNGNSVKPNTHTTSYKQKKKRGTTSIAFAGAQVTNVSATPAVTYKPTVIKVTAAHKKNVVDPVSALLFTTNGDHSGAAVCNRSVAIFDGKERYDIKVSHVSTKTRKVTGFRGPVHTCSVRYVPVAGHRPEKKSIQRLAKNRSIRIEMARIGKSNAYGLFGFSASTERGTARGTATKFKVQ